MSNFTTVIDDIDKKDQLNAIQDKIHELETIKMELTGKQIAYSQEANLFFPVQQPTMLKDIQTKIAKLKEKKAEIEKTTKLTASTDSPSKGIFN